MLTGKQIIAGTVLTVTLTLTGCASRRQAAQGYFPQRTQAFSMPQTTTSPYDAGGMMTPGTMAPIPDPQMQLPAVGGETVAPSLPSLGELAPVNSMSAKPRKGIFRFIPSLRRKAQVPVVTGGDGQWPTAGSVLTEEQFNALPGAHSNQMAPNQQYSNPSAHPMPSASVPHGQMQQMVPTPETQLPPARSNHYQTSLVVPAQAGRGAVAPIRRVSSARVVQHPAQRQHVPAVNFGGSWGQRVNGPATIVADVVREAQPLEVPGKSESYDMWPGAQAGQVAQPMMDASNSVGVAVANDVATQLLPVSKPRVMLPVIAPATR